jgi:ABC-2 type transport system ATP-binding protein
VSYSYDTQSTQTGITSLLQDVKESGLRLKDIKTEQSSLENIFVELVQKDDE